MQVGNVLHAARCKCRTQKVDKNRHLGTIPQLCRAISSQLRHASTIGKKFVKQQYLLYMSSQYGKLRATSGWDRFVSLGHPCKFQLVSRLGSVTARHSRCERQPNFAALNRGRHLCSAGRPSRWALAHILVLLSFFLSSPNLSGRRLDVYRSYIDTWCGLSANLECRFEMCCKRLAGNTGRKNDAKIAQICRAMSSQLRHVLTIGKKTC